MKQSGLEEPMLGTLRAWRRNRETLLVSFNEDRRQRGCSLSVGPGAAG